MATKIKVFDAPTALKSIEEKGSSIITIERKKGKDDKTYSGVRFLNLGFNIGTELKKQGWFSIKDVVITRGPADPEDKNDPRNEYITPTTTQNKLQTSCSNSGPFGEFLLKLNDVWLEKVAEMKARKDIPSTKKIFELVQARVSENAKENAEEPIEDPIIRFKVDFDKFSDKYPHAFLRGQPKTQFFDYSTRYIDDKGFEKFMPAVIVNENGEEEPVSNANLHKFVKTGAIIRKGRINISSVAVSGPGVSMPMMLTTAVIEQAPDSGFDDEDEPVVDVSAVSETFAREEEENPTTGFGDDEEGPSEPAAAPAKPETTSSRDEIGDALASL